MKLDQMKVTIACASPLSQWPRTFANCYEPTEGSMSCGPTITNDDKDEEETQAQYDQEFTLMARREMIKVIDSLELIRFACHVVDPDNLANRILQIIKLLEEET